jgi:hypothetical protein
MGKNCLLKSVVLSLLVFATSSVLGATITVTGETTVCPGNGSLYIYEYTATATNVFGNVNGYFDYAFYENGSWVYHGSIPCNEISQTHSITFQKQWSFTGPAQIRVRFKANYVPCGSLDQTFTNVNVRVFSPGIPSDADGALVFCGPNQTKTITIPGVPWGACNWHHKYDWIVPAGWTVVPTDNGTFVAIDGGIRTFATSVYITTPAGSLSQGFTGGYFITVRTEAAWPWPIQETRQIWIGGPTTISSINGPSNGNEGSVYTFSVSGGKGAKFFNWTWPSGWGAPASTPTGTAIATPWSNSGYVTVTAGNSCGNSNTSQKYVTVSTCQNCLTIVSPNPSPGGIKIGTKGKGDDKTASDFAIYDSSGGLVMTGALTDETEVDLSSYKKGTYFVKVKMGNGRTEQHRIVISD